MAALQGINVNGTLHRIDYDYLENKPDASDFLPTVTSADVGKVLQVNTSGEWTAATLIVLPAVTSADTGKVLQVNSSGSWAAATLANAEEATF